MRFAFPVVFLLTLTSAFAQQAPVPDSVAWQPVTEQDQRASAPVIDKDAGAEALFWRVHVFDDMWSGEVRRIYYNYVRLKIFNESGKQKASSIEIPVDKDVSVDALFGRTIKADGTIVELKKDAIFEREVVRSGGLRRKVVSFAMPAVEPGALVEYRWKEMRWSGHFYSTYIRMPLQREFPVRRVTYFIRPLRQDMLRAGTQMNVLSFHCQTTPPKLESSGFSSISLDNVPAFEEEPYAPSASNLQPWALAYYFDGKRREPDEYWTNAGKNQYQSFKPMLRVSDEIRKAAAEAATGAATEEEKVLALLRCLRARVANLWGPGVDQAARNKIVEKLSKNQTRTSAEVFKSGLGTPDEMNGLFAAMALAVGLDARPALVANWNDLAFQPALANEYFLRNVDMAVKVGDQWRVFDASTRRLPDGMLSWSEEGVYALISDPKKPQFIQTPVSAPEASQSARDARLKLAEDGSIEGDIRETFTGHAALDGREDFENESAERRQELVKDRVRGVFSSAEVSQIKVENVEDAAQPLKIQYHVKVPAYAQRTGKRILVQPLYFERGAAPRFSAATRKYPVSFRYGWQEKEHVAIELPAGFALDNAANPGSLRLANVGMYDLKISVRAGKELVVDREMTFGKEARLQFGAEVYPQLKQAFDIIHTRDNTIVSLKAADAK
ncbi:MAG: DUF3857 domain-containing protein [Acidobacteriota bacterium]